MSLHRSLIATCVIIIFSTAATIAAVPSSMNVQGRLTDASGAPLPPGTKTLTFKIYDDSTGGIEIWPAGPGETQLVASDVAGLWTTRVGALVPLTDVVFSDTACWLEIAVDDGIKALVTLPRVRLTTGPYAHRVATVDAASGGTLTSKLTIGTTNTNTGTDAFVAGLNNTASGNFSTVGGGEANVASGMRSTVSGGWQNTASNLRAVVGGGIANTASGNRSGVGAGGDNAASGLASYVGGGLLNSASGETSTVPGGRSNSAVGRFSFAAGRRAQANHDGSFVWADSTDADFSTTAPNQFLISASGGVGIGTNLPFNPSSVLVVSDEPPNSWDQMVRFRPKSNPGLSNDVLEIMVPEADLGFQFIECEDSVSDVKFRVSGYGSVTADGTISGGGADFAEMVAVSTGVLSVASGDVMVIDPNNLRAVIPSTAARSPLVAGIYSTAPGFIASPHDWDQTAMEKGLSTKSEVSGEATAIPVLEVGAAIGEIPVAVVGIVPCKVTDENGAISPGDLLVTSSIPGHAMRDESPKIGTVLGKALGTLESGTGVIEVLVTLQ